MLKVGFNADLIKLKFLLKTLSSQHSTLVLRNIAFLDSNQ